MVIYILTQNTDSQVGMDASEIRQDKFHSMARVTLRHRTTKTLAGEALAIVTTGPELLRMGLASVSMRGKLIYSRERFTKR